MSAPARARRRVLIVDDDPRVARITVAHVESAGAEAMATSSVAEFFKVYDAWEPDTAIVDLVLGREDGLSVLRQLSERDSGVRVIIASGVGQRVIDAATRFALANGLEVKGVLVKPYRRAALAELLNGDAVDSRIANGKNDGLFKEEHPRPTVDEVAEAIAGRAITIALQPKVSCTKRHLAGFEALARWNHPRLGDVGPAVFVAIAERLGIVSEITDMVLDQSLAWLARAYPNGPHIAVNVSAVELTSSDIVERVEACCATYQIAHSRVIIEVTESGATQDGLAALEILTHLRLAGFGLSIDDFGTGYSSMAQVARMPFSELKVDRAFVGDMMTNPESRVIVNSTITLAKSLGLSVTAEGVDDPHALTALATAGCDLAQGYLIARPMSPAEARTWSPSQARVVGGQRVDSGGEQ